MDIVDITQKREEETNMNKLTMIKIVVFRGKFGGEKIML